jgi:hypothetical protein
VVVNEEDKEDDDYEYLPRRRYAYSREHKLAAIDYFQITWRKNKDSTFERLSCRFATRKLKITRRMLRSWVAKEKIMAQKKGSFRSRKEFCRVQESKMEMELNTEFEKAREQGRKISYKWILRHAKEIYGRIDPHRVIQRDGYKKAYLGFKFSSGW